MVNFTGTMTGWKKLVDKLFNKKSSSKDFSVPNLDKLVQESSSKDFSIPKDLTTKPLIPLASESSLKAPNQNILKAPNQNILKAPNQNILKVPNQNVVTNMGATPMQKGLQAEYGTIDEQLGFIQQQSKQNFQNQLAQLAQAKERARIKAYFIGGIGGSGVSSQLTNQLSLKDFNTKKDLIEAQQQKQGQLQFQRDLNKRELSKRLAADKNFMSVMQGQRMSQSKKSFSISQDTKNEMIKNGVSSEDLGAAAFNDWENKWGSKKFSKIKDALGDYKNQIGQIIADNSGDFGVNNKNQIINYDADTGIMKTWSVQDDELVEDVDMSFSQEDVQILVEELYSNQKEIRDTLYDEDVDVKQFNAMSDRQFPIKFREYMNRVMYQKLIEGKISRDDFANFKMQIINLEDTFLNYPEMLKNYINSYSKNQ